MLLLVSMWPSLLAIRCYDYLSSNENRHRMKSWVECPNDTRFCFKSYIEQEELSNEKTWLENRSCEIPGVCLV
ncbi:hypothetical protein Angca_001093, partial [Angiostrongylus cantonensis]